jgi:hypothetical protein
MGMCGLLDSPCSGPFSLGARFETYEPFIPLIFQIFSGRRKLQITETADSEFVDMGVRMHMKNYCCTRKSTFQ